MILFYLFILNVFVLRTRGQILDDSNQKDDSSHKSPNKYEGGSHANFDSLFHVMEEISKKVSTIDKRIDNFDKMFHYRFQILSEAIADEKVSIENIHSRLDSLDFLSIKVEDVKLKLEDESSFIKNVLSATSNDMKKVSERLELLEKSTVQNQHKESESFTNRDSESFTNRDQESFTNRDQESFTNRDQESFTYKDSESFTKKNKKEAIVERHSKEIKSNTTILAHEQKSIQEKNEEKEAGELVVQTIENIMPRLLAAELNHFYLNMATKTDYSMKHLETLLSSKLKKIEMLAKNSLLEIKDGRQDMSHVTHLQRTIIDKFPRQLLRQNSSCEAEFRRAFDTFDQKISTKIDSLKINENVSSNQANYDVNPSFRAKLSPQNPYGSSGLWKGIFDPILSRSSSNVPGSSVIPGTNLAAQKTTCLDPTASNTLQEVKQLLRTLMSKGEDLRRTLTEQANEGVDLLKHLHQRFSVLLRRINTDPKHVEALLAEVQELEHLVENSYSSILLAQNLFLESCRADQKQELSTEGQIIDVLNKLVTNIDLGHQFNKKQLEEVRQLIERMNTEEQSQNLTILSAWNPVNISANQFEKDRFTKLSNMNIFDNFKSSVLEANITEEKIRGVLKRIGDVEEKLQSLDLSSGNAKNVIDELLTSTKDLKNYSKDQILLLETFQNDIIKFVNISKNVVVKTLSKKDSKHPKFQSVLNDAESSQISPSCYHSLLRALNSSTILSFPDDTLFSIRNITNIFQTVINNTRIKSNNPTTNYDDILMDDDYKWFNNNYYYDDDEEDGAFLVEGYEVNKKRNKVASKRYVDNIHGHSEEKHGSIHGDTELKHGNTHGNTEQKHGDIHEYTEQRHIDTHGNTNQNHEYTHGYGKQNHEETHGFSEQKLENIPGYPKQKHGDINLPNHKNSITNPKSTTKGYHLNDKYNNLNEIIYNDHTNGHTISEGKMATGRAVVRPKISMNSKIPKRNKVTILENDFQ